MSLDVRSGDKVKLRSEPDKWWTVAKVIDLTADRQPFTCKLLLFVEPHAPATEPNIIQVKRK